MGAKKNTKKVTPLSDKVLVEPIDAEAIVSGGIIIPDTIDKEKPERGKVIAVGPGRTNEKGNIVPMSVSVGQTVLFSKYGPDEVNVDGKDLFIISESSILAIIE